jgi:hypothetical protein
MHFENTNIGNILGATVLAKRGPAAPRKQTVPKHVFKIFVAKFSIIICIPDNYWKTFDINLIKTINQANHQKF